MELLNEIKFFNRTNKIPSQCLKEAFLNTMLFEETLSENDDPVNSPERVDVLNHIKYERWKWNDEYAPKGWNYDKYGRPDVILRRLKNFKA